MSYAKDPVIINRINEYTPVRKYYSKLEKNINIKKSSICIRRSKQVGYKEVINIKTNKKYFKIESRLGVTKSSKQTGRTNTEADVHESVYGEVYHATFVDPSGKKQSTAIKVMPMTEEEYKNKFNIVYDSWKELQINKTLTNKYTLTKKWPHFSIYFGYFICSDGHIRDFSNKNIVNQMRLRQVLVKLLLQYKEMKNTISDFNPTNRTTMEIANNITSRIRSLGLELEQYEYTIRSPDPKFSILMLIELENDSLSGNLSKYNIDLNPSKLEYYYKIRMMNRLHIAKRFKNPLIYEMIYDSYPRDNQYLIRIYDNISSPKDKGYNLHTGRYLDMIYVYSIIFQVLLSIEEMSRAGIAHLDMHVDNILLDYSNIPFEEEFDHYSFWKYKVKNNNYFIPNYGVQVRIGDYGLSETVESYKRRNKREKRDFIMYLLDRLAYFVFTKKEEKRIDELSDEIINNFVKLNPPQVFRYLKLYDTLIFLISLISELEYIGQEKYIHDLRFQSKCRYSMQAHKGLWIPPFLNSLRLFQSNILNIFIDNLSGQRQTKIDYLTLIDDILNVFNANDIKLNRDDTIINDKPYSIITYS